MFATVVVGVDGRSGGRDALALAALLQRKFCSKVTAVHAYPREFFVTRDADSDVDALMHAHAQDGLDDEVETVAVDATAIAVPDWSPARALHLVAERENADLIVVGSDHHGPLGRVVAGDVAHATLTRAQCPVAVAPSGMAVAQPTLSKIGVGLDGSDESQAAVELAHQMAESVGSSIELRWVLPYLGSGRPLTPRHWELSENAKELEDFSERLDVLVVGSRHVGSGHRILVGAASPKLLRSAHCPVLVVPGGVTGERPVEPSARQTAELAR